MPSPPLTWMLLRASKICEKQTHPPLSQQEVLQGKGLPSFRSPSAHSKSRSPLPPDIVRRGEASLLWIQTQVVLSQYLTAGRLLRLHLVQKHLCWQESKGDSRSKATPPGGPVYNFGSPEVASGQEALATIRQGKEKSH